MKHLFTLLLLLSGINAFSQSAYQYKVDLTNVKDDKVLVELTPPPINEKEINFNMPKIIPGTYIISDFGKFVSDLKAFDKKGKALPVKRIDENSWNIEKANKLAKLTYWVEDTYDTDLSHQVYPMSGSNIEENKNFVIAPPAFFGYFEGKKEVPFNISFTKPEGFYASTGLIPTMSSVKNDNFKIEDYDKLVDSPIMYNKPDTTTVMVGDTKVLVSVYSPNNMVTSEYLSENLEVLLKATKEYLGGSLPVDKYAFIFYFDPSENPQTGQGALEHSYSSFYYISETPQQAIISELVNIASHEFFHIVTPLTIHSDEIANFDFNTPDLSKHLWLYEGVTEYASDHVQVQEDLISIPEYISRLAEKIYISKEYFNDSLPFTELSEKAADIHQEQYPNVYEKGALIAAMLDIRLNELSEGKYNLQYLLRDLGKKFGPDKPFKDEELFPAIEDLTYPEIQDFFKSYVEDGKSLPFVDYFDKVGIRYIPFDTVNQFTLGNINIGYDQATGSLYIVSMPNLNEFGKAMGYQEGDVIREIEGTPFTIMSGQQLLEQLNTSIKEGDTLDVLVERNGEQILLQQVVFFVERPILHQLKIMDSVSYQQLKLRNHWLKPDIVTAKPEDVESIDAIIDAIYDVISGPAGDRDWDRFYSLYIPDVLMGAIASTPEGPVYVKMTPDEYKERNSLVFNQTGFYEEELHRVTEKYDNIAHVFSTYQFRFQKDGPVMQRGINSIQLAYFQNRWWIVSILWNGETEKVKIPSQYLD